MPQVIIYRNERLVETRKFVGHFFITGNKILFWRIYENQDWTSWTTDEEHKVALDKLEEAYQQTKLLNIGNTYELSSLLPNWELWVNGEKCLKGLYLDVRIVWRELRLEYQDYKFIFQFAIEEVQTESAIENLPLPNPVLTEAQTDKEYWENR